MADQISSSKCELSANSGWATKRIKAICAYVGYCKCFLAHLGLYILKTT